MTTKAPRKINFRLNVPEVQLGRVDFSFPVRAELVEARIFSLSLEGTIASKCAIGRPGTKAQEHIDYRLNDGQNKTGAG
jgi:hypothetical protein